MFIFFLSLGTVAASKYHLGQRIDQGGNGMVYLATVDGEPVVVKCGAPSNTILYKREYGFMERLAGESWSIRPIEFYMAGDSPCIVMEALGTDLEKIRDASGDVWSVTTVASIGLGVLDALQTMHLEFGLAHTDMHPGNIATRMNDPTKLVVFDFGDMKPIGNKAMRKDDLVQAMLAMRWFLDGDRIYYAAKRYRYDQAQLCEGIPGPLCEVIDFAYQITTIDLSHYNRIRYMLLKMIADEGGEYDGKIIWGKDVMQRGVNPRSKSVVQRRAPIPEHATKVILEQATEVKPERATVIPEHDQPKPSGAEHASVLKSDPEAISAGSITTTKSSHTLYTTCLAIAVLIISTC